MGVDVSAGNFEFILDGVDVSQLFERDLGWWRLRAMGWGLYTDLRDLHAHERTGLGRPWLYKLPVRWQDLIFRELLLLVDEVGKISQRNWFFMPAELPVWMKYWLTLTNDAWRQGVAELTQEVIADRGWFGDAEGEEIVEKLTAAYLRSEKTWRPMMPDRAEHHRGYGDRPAYWSFER